MIAEILPGCYDAVGRPVLRPELRRHGFHPTFPIGRYFSQPLTIRAESIQDIRKFLLTCRPVEDKEQFGKEDYWQPPEQFEKTRRGDCEDFALWTWRQLLALGYHARFVVGESGRFGMGHAWVTMQHEGRYFVVEPQCCVVGEKLPRLSTARLTPKLSVEWDGDHIHWYQHRQLPFHPPLSSIPGLVCEWGFRWGWFWLKKAPIITFVLGCRLWNRLWTGHAAGPRHEKI